MANKAKFERPSHNQPTTDQRPAFQTALGYVLWDIHSGKYPDRLVPHADAAEIARLKVSTFTRPGRPSSGSSAPPTMTWWT